MSNGVITDRAIELYVDAENGRCRRLTPGVYDLPWHRLCARLDRMQACQLDAAAEAAFGRAHATRAMRGRWLELTRWEIEALQRIADRPARQPHAAPERARVSARLLASVVLRACSESSAEAALRTCQAACFAMHYPHRREASGERGGAAWIAAGDGGWLDREAKRVAAEVLDEVAGPAAQPIDERWFAWNDGAVRKMAGVLYAQAHGGEDCPHTFIGKRRHLAGYTGREDYSGLPLLADALEDAGCANADLLGHLRKPGRHLMGCWALDLLTQQGRRKKK